jgi:hypothetical protein
LPNTRKPSHGYRIYNQEPRKGEAMTAAQWESWTERIAIMEYEDGLDRKAATLAAFSLYFPGDYQAMNEGNRRRDGGGRCRPL